MDSLVLCVTNDILHVSSSRETWEGCRTLDRLARLLSDDQPAIFFFLVIWSLILAFSYSLLKVLTMMGMGREMMRTPQMAQVAPHSFPNQVLSQVNSV